MTDLFGQVIEISLSMSVLIVILFVFSKTMHQRYRASLWSCLLAIALRLILPWNITLPSAAVKIPVPQRMVQPLPVTPVFRESPELKAEVPSKEPLPSDNLQEKTEENTMPPTGFSISILQILTVVWILGMGYPSFV